MSCKLSKSAFSVFQMRSSANIINILGRIILIVTIAASCATSEIGVFSDSEYAVYLAVVRSQPEAPIVINTEIDTFGEISSGKLTEIIPGIRPDTIRDWVDRNSAPVTVPPGLSFQKGYEVIPLSQKERLVDFYSFTRVGFSQDGCQAFVRFSFVCGGLCGEGAFYLLEKKSGQWEISFKSETWKA